MPFSSKGRLSHGHGGQIRGEKKTLGSLGSHLAGWHCHCRCVIPAGNSSCSLPPSPAVPPPHTPPGSFLFSFFAFPSPRLAERPCSDTATPLSWVHVQGQSQSCHKRAENEGGLGAGTLHIPQHTEAALGEPTENAEKLHFGCVWSCGHSRSPALSFSNSFRGLIKSPSEMKGSSCSNEQHSWVWGEK